ncbi:hypothetical protein [Acaryochloris sp. CCMEE 5410]|uniref:hypothetical protein n=1 Tax=Acaryochloris sp. CCMEE 5410 TaxID=310037 RepID=UPI000248428D|nr:hypothetical protein [Acaryochloris sp. CCMEE 5410]KAI9132832.1 hypothetical protein ON05_005405 [Acaryochloris sp. CCMEE 5410]
MSASSPLTGIELIDCAKANAKKGAEFAAQQCGYGSQTDKFLNAVQAACQSIGVDVEELQDLISDPHRPTVPRGIEIAPETPTKL